MIPIGSSKAIIPTTQVLPKFLQLLSPLLLFIVPIELIAQTPPVTALAYAAQSQQVFVGSQQGIARLAFPSMKAAGSLATQLEQVHDLAISPDGRWMLAAGGTPGESGEVELWNLDDGKLSHTFKAHSDLAYGVAWSHNCDSFVSASADGSCQVFQRSDVGPIAKFSGHSKPVLAVQFIDPTTVVSMGVDQTLRCWTAANGKPVRVLDNHVGSVLSARLRPRNTETTSPVELVSCSEDKTVRLWQPTTGRLLRFARVPSVPQCVCWSIDGKTIWVGCRDGKLRAIDPETAQITRETECFEGWIYEIFAITADRLVVAGEDGCHVIETYDDRHRKDERSRDDLK